MTDVDETNELNITKYRGDSFVLDLLETDANGDPVDLTSATVRVQIGTLTESTSGVTITNGGTAGTLNIVASYAAMAALAVGNHDIAVEVTYSSGIRRTMFTGSLELVEDVRT